MPAGKLCYTGGAKEGEAHEHGKNDEPKEKNQSRRHKQIAGNAFAPARGAQAAVDAGGSLHAAIPLF